MGKTAGARVLGMVGMVFAMLMLTAGTSQAADPVVNPGSSFNAIVTGGEIKIGSKLEPIDVGAMNPSPRLRNITVNPDGSFTAAASDFVFPPLILPVDSPVGKVDISVHLRASTPVTGTIDPTSGALSLNTSLTIQLTSSHAIVALGNNCYVGTPASPIPFAAAGNGSQGIPYDEYAGTASIVDGVLAIPGATGCPTIFGNNVNQIVNDEMGLPSATGLNTVTLDLRFNPAPHSENWVDPEGPGNIPPTIVNDTVVTAPDGMEQRSWLESLAISNDRDQNNDHGDTGGSALNRAGNTLRMSLLVKHNPGRKVTALKIDDNWDENDDSDSASPMAVTAEQPVVSGGFNYSRVTVEYQAPQAGMGLTCPGFFDSSPEPRIRSRQVSVRAVLDNGAESESSISGIRLTRADCNAKDDGPMVYGWQEQNPGKSVTPFTPVTFTFRSDDTDDSFLTGPNQVGGYTWRTRNLDTGFTSPGQFVCAGTNIDNAVRTIQETFNQRGRWVVEAQIHNLNGPTANDCQSNAFGSNVRPWYWIGAVDVNSASEVSGVKSPDVTLSAPNRPAIDGSVTASVNTNDPFDVSNGGLTQTVEWDLDGDANNGFEVVRYGDSRSGMGPGQNQILFDTSSLPPGPHTIRVRVGDNGALGGADDIRRTNVTSAQILINTPPSAENLSVTTAEGNSVPVPLVSSDVNGDNLSWELAEEPSNGFLSGEWPNRVYHPKTGFHGTDSFKYQVSDGFGGTATGTVTVTVTKANNPVDPPEPPAPGPEKQALKATFEEGRVNLNEQSGPGTSGVKVVDSTVPDPPVTFDTKHWDRATGQILAPPSDLTIPAKTVSMSITDPLPLDLEVTIEFAAVGNIGGSFNPGTGAMSLDFDARALITVSAAEPLGQVLKCDVTPIPLKLSTSGGNLIDPGNGSDRPAHTWSAKAFGADLSGAVTSLWNDLPSSTALAEPMAPLATCGDTLDDLVGGKGGFWLGGKVTFEGSPEEPKVITPNPKPGEAIFDGKRLHIRLKCPARFRPSCQTTSAPMTKKKKGKAMSKPIKRKIKAGKWTRVTYLIKPKFRARVLKMAGKKQKTLIVRQKIKSKKINRKRFKGKPKVVFHKYRVRTG